MSHRSDGRSSTFGNGDAAAQPASVPSTSIVDEAHAADNRVDALQCPTCGRLFPSSRSLTEHTRKQHVDEQSCPHCTYSCSLVHMKNHISSYHGNEIRCVPCAKTLKNLNSAQAHARSQGHQAKMRVTESGGTVPWFAFADV